MQSEFSFTKSPSKDAAKNLIRVYVVRGDSIESLKAGQGGCACDEFRGSIGGYVNGKRISTDNIIIDRVGKEDLTPPHIYNLKAIYEEILEDIQLPDIGNLPDGGER